VYQSEIDMPIHALHIQTPHMPFAANACSGAKFNLHQ
jgi:hypothetical protein